MRNNSTPQIETRELSDGDLDGISGGLVGEVVQTVESLLPAVSSLVSVAANLDLSVSGPVNLDAIVCGGAKA